MTKTQLLTRVSMKFVILSSECANLTSMNSFATLSDDVMILRLLSEATSYMKQTACYDLSQMAKNFLLSETAMQVTPSVPSTPTEFEKRHIKFKLVGEWRTGLCSL